MGSDYELISRAFMLLYLKQSSNCEMLTVWVHFTMWYCRKTKFLMCGVPLDPV